MLCVKRPALPPVMDSIPETKGLIINLQLGGCCSERNSESFFEIHSSYGLVICYFLSFCVLRMQKCLGWLYYLLHVFSKNERQMEHEVNC